MMNELSQVLDELISCGEGMIRAANALREYFSDTSAKQTPVPDESDVKEEPKQYSFAEVRKKFAAKSHAGHTDEVKSLIGKFGATRLSDVSESDYPELMEALEAIE